MFPGTMLGYFIVVTVLLGEWNAAHAKPRETSAVYGFQGAIGALAQGQVLHYNVNLGSCKLVEGSEEHPEFTEPFGGHVDHYRTINEREPEETTNLVFYLQKLVFNSTGKLVQLSREITVWANNTVIVRSLVYTPDFGVMTLMYEHACTMESTNLTVADVSLRASGTPTHLFKFDDILHALKEGQAVTFSVMTFLCAGGREASYSGFGGHIPNYDVVNEHLIDSTIKPTVHYDAMGGSMMDSINVRFYDNRTVELIDRRGKPPALDVIREHVLNCFLETGPPGGTVNVFTV